MQYEHSSWTSKLLFLFVVPIVSAFRNPGTHQLPEVPPALQFSEGYERLKRNWSAQQTRSSPSFFQATVRTVGAEFIFYSICMGFNLIPGLL